MSEPKILKGFVIIDGEDKLVSNHIFTSRGSACMELERGFSIQNIVPATLIYNDKEEASYEI